MLTETLFRFEENIAVCESEVMNYSLGYIGTFRFHEVPYRRNLRRGKLSSVKIFVGEKYSSLDQKFITAPLKLSVEIFRRGKVFVT